MEQYGIYKETIQYYKWVKRKLGVNKLGMVKSKLLVIKYNISYQ